VAPSYPSPQQITSQTWNWWSRLVYLLSGLHNVLQDVPLLLIKIGVRVLSKFFEWAKPRFMARGIARVTASVEGKGNSSVPPILGR
jgi:hypothetical protein